MELDLPENLASEERSIALNVLENHLDASPRMGDWDAMDPTGQTGLITGQPLIMPKTQ